MTLAPGKKLGPYEIVAAIGAGGMGEVYRARDTRLDREVAIKVLPEIFANDEKLRARFEREAKSISSLNHPHICTLHDVGRQEATPFLVMELLDGESLADRLQKGPLPVDQVLRYGAQIADALHHAHKAGVVHRDLKPGNVMLTKKGAKLLDFGLARTSSEASPVQGLTALPTQAKPLTTEGTILGTFQYMAPEQLEGVEADARTDLFALGAVLYEMATGQKAFAGKSRTSLIAAIVSSQPPPISSVQPMSPPALDHVVRKCLEKDPDDRWQSAHDVASQLRWVSEAGSQAGIAGPITVRRKTRERVVWLLSGVLALVALGAAAIAWRGRESPLQPEKQSVMRFVVPVGRIRAAADMYRTVAVSPGGKAIAWVDSEGDVPMAYLKRIGEFEARPIPGTENAVQLFFSPDGKWLGFFANDKLKKVPLSGGAPIALAKVVYPRGASWSDDDTIVFVPFLYGGIERIPAAGGTPEVLTKVDREKGEVCHRWPFVLPGSKAFLFSIGLGTSWDEAKIAVQRIGSGERKILIEGGSDGRYLPTGHLAYVRGDSLYAVRFDPDTLKVSGDPVRLVEGIAQGSAGTSEYSFSDNGLLAYRSTGSLSDEGGTLSLLDRNGRRVSFNDSAISGRLLGYPRLGPDGNRIAGNIGYELWAFDLVRGTSARLTSGTRASWGVWSPDGRFLAYSQERRNPWNPYIRKSDGSEPEQLLMKSEASLTPRAWSPDGQWILMGRIQPDTGLDLMKFSVKDKKMKPFVVTEHSEITAAFSPDGKWVAYSSDESGRPEIYVRAFDGSEGRWQISTGGAAVPFWKKLDEIIFQSGQRVLSVRVRTSPAFSAEPPKVLFESPFALAGIMPDGNRFLVVDRRGAGTLDVPLRVVANWFSEVREKTSR